MKSKKPIMKNLSLEFYRFLENVDVVVSSGGRQWQTADSWQASDGTVIYAIKQNKK